MSEKTINNDKLKGIYDFSIDVLGKRYDTYQWCEDKVNTLVTLNGLLIGALFVTIDKIFSKSECLNFVMASLAILFLATSLALSLYHIIPKMNSGRITRNIRTVIGTEQFDSNESYFDEYLKLELIDMVKLNTEQIRGMNKNIMKNQIAIRIAAICSIIGMVLFLVLIFNFIIK